MKIVDSDGDLDDYMDDFDEPVMDGNDDFSDLRDDLDEIEEDAVDSTSDPAVNSGLANLSSYSGSGSGTVDSAVPNPSTHGSAVPESDPLTLLALLAHLGLPGQWQQCVFLSSRSLHQQVRLKIPPHCQ